MPTAAEPASAPKPPWHRPIERWLDGLAVERGLSPHTVAAYRRDLVRLAKDLALPRTRTGCSARWRSWRSAPLSSSARREGGNAVILARFTVGPFAENVYVVGVPPRVAVVDPGGESERVMEAIDREGWQPEAILLTHAHIDHIAHCAHVAERYRIGVTVHRDDLPGGDAQTLVRSIRERLFALDGDYTCWPGHGAETTLSEERRDNPFVGQGAVAF